MHDDNALSHGQTDELELLRRRNAELQHRVNELTHDRDLLLELIENAPATIAVRDLGRRFLLANRAMEAAVNMSREQLLATHEDALLHPSILPDWIAHDREVSATGNTIAREFLLPIPGGAVHLIVHKFPLYNQAGDQYAIGTIATNITEQKQVEIERAALQQQMIEAQQAALRELGTPLVPITDGVVAMPLVGAIDSARAQMIMETLLEGISALQARVAILDITGVKVVDTQVASALIRAAQAAQLLGARVMLTGISSDVAQSLVQLGADLQRIETRSTLQAAIASALGKA